ncbi:MAG: metallophosphoesterase [Bacteriovoracaceae bacterium]|nr:metallophosphoesterase [Bacteriovoracaceae bacterium]
MKKPKIIFLLIPVLILVYSICFEPYQLEISFHELEIGTKGKNIIAAHITDLHTSSVGTLELKLIDSILTTKPDIIFITGDIATPGGTVEGYMHVLSQFHAPLGVYFVQGNWEYWEPIKELSDILKKTNIVDLTNKIVHIKDDLWLAGLDDELAGSPELDIYESIPKNAKIISIFHSPTLFNSINNKTDLAFAGHSHGGQIRFPFIGPLWTPEGTGSYDSGWFQEERARMYVSRGLGNSILPIRFNCKPEIAFIKINY